MNSTKFDTAYRQLNQNQKLAVDTLEGPVMVIAGPGTGKTQIITLRIANILSKTQTDPQSILALTFTDSGVKAMKERLVEFIGPTGYKVEIFTFHSFCQKIIEENPESFSISSDFMVLSDLERVNIFKDIIDSIELDTLKPKNSPYFYIQTLVSKLSDLKKEGITIDKFKEIIKKEESSLDINDYLNKRTGKPSQKYYSKLKSIRKWKELSIIYENYQEELIKRKRYDYDDMITYVIDKFANDDEILAKYQEQYQYILADEYQDTNTGQNEVIRLLTSFEYIDKPNIFVVGDDEQSIYRFQGASLENFTFFEDIYPELKKITLTTNYRSTQNILDASRSMIENNENRLEDLHRLLDAYQEYENKKIKVVKTSHEFIEKYYLAQKIKELLSSGVNPNEIAVLYRTNAEGRDLSQVLGKFEIKSQSVKGENVLDDIEIKKIIKILQVIFETQDELKNRVNDDFFWSGEKSDKDVNLFTIMHYSLFDINPTDILKLIKFASEEKKHLSEVLNEKQYLLQIDLESSENITSLWDKINKWRKDSLNLPFSKFLENIIRESGLIEDFINAEDRIDKLNKLNKFFSELKNFNYSQPNLDLVDFFNTLSLRQKNKISIPVDDIKRDEDAIQLMTAHSAKGLEYEYVFLYKCVDGVWGNRRKSDLLSLPDGVINYSDITKLEKNEDERRLFYVAMTRAKKELYLLFANNYIEYNSEKTRLPSTFVNEINNDFIEYINVDEYEEDIETVLEILTNSEVSIDKTSASEEEFLNNIVKYISISPSSLNTYLQCAYKYKLDRLFSIPKVKEIPLAFGTSVHKGLEDYFRTYSNTGKYPPVELAINSFKKELERQLLSKDDFNILISRGIEILEDYIENTKDENLEIIGTEYNFGSKNVYLNNIKLSGKVDRIDIINKDRKHVRVIDYKTGKPKSLNEILGKTKNSDESYKRQLVFYKLLSQLDKSFNQVVKSTRLEFIERGYNNKHQFVEYQVTDEDLKILRQQIKETVSNIKKLNFNRTTEIKNCTNCQYKDHCWPEGIDA